MEVKHSFGDATSKKTRVETGPSPVLFFWNLPVNTTEADVTQLCANFGNPVTALRLKGKNQAFVQMCSMEAATQLLDYFKNQGSKPVIRGEPVDVQYSSRTHISKKPDSEYPGGLNSGVPNMMVMPGAYPVHYGQSPAQPQSGAAQGLANMPDLPGRILHINITNPTHPVSCDILYYVFSQYGGTILRIVVFQKNGVHQALVEFSDANSALVAKTVLQGHSVFTDGCVLRIDHSKLTTVNIREGDANARDYTTSYGVPMASSHLLPTGLAPGKQHRGAGGSEDVGRVVLVGNLNTEKVTPLALFKLFGTCGDVMRVKIMYNKRDTALIQFRTETQAKQAIQLMQGAVLYGICIHVQLSRMSSVSLPPPGSTELFEGLTQDFESSTLHRFSRPGSRNEQNIAMPSESLHIANILETAEEQSLVQLFSTFGMVVAFKFLPNTRKMAVVRFNTIENAISALIALHGAPEAAAGLCGDRGLMISFSKSGTLP
eukprot:RCo039039